MDKEKRVSTLAVEWIEISMSPSDVMSVQVSTLAVEWIEIDQTKYNKQNNPVSTLAVEWIEIYLWRLYWV